MPNLILTPEHIYKYEGHDVPGTTSIINADHSFCDEFYRTRGQYGHAMVEMHLTGMLDEEALDDQLRPYLEAFKLFQTEAPHVKGIIDIKLGQKMPWHILQVCAYRELWINGINEDGEPLKTLKWGQEVMGYHPIWRYCGKIDIIDIPNGILPEAIDLYLQANGKYKLESVKMGTERKHTNAFLTLVSAYHVRQEYKI